MFKRIICGRISFPLLTILFIIGCHESDFPEDPTILETDAAWSPDDSTIAYYLHPTAPEGNAGIWLVDADGTNDRFLCEGMQVDWSPDGERLVVATLGWNIFLIDKNGENKEWLIEDGKSNSPAWSPDGNWVAFVRPFAYSGLDLINLETQEETAIPDVGRGDWAPNNLNFVYMYGEEQGRKQTIRIINIHDSTVEVINKEFDIYEYGAFTPPAAGRLTAKRFSS